MTLEQASIGAARRSADQLGRHASTTHACYHLGPMSERRALCWLQTFCRDGDLRRVSPTLAAVRGVALLRRDGGGGAKRNLCTLRVWMAMDAVEAYDPENPTGDDDHHNAVAAAASDTLSWFHQGDALSRLLMSIASVSDGVSPPLAQ